jgi:hypothetical protein
MKAHDWIAKQSTAALAAAVDLTLPSGIVIKARRPDPLQLATWGVMPASLVGGIAPERITAQDVEQIARLHRDLLVWCCLEPRISLTPAEGEVHPKDIPWEDAQFIVHWALRIEEAQQLESFRGQPPDGRPGVNGGGVPPAPIQSVVHRGPGAGGEL